jgi:hypothetical protein
MILTTECALIDKEDNAGGGQMVVYARNDVIAKPFIIKNPFTKSERIFLLVYNWK